MEVDLLCDDDPLAIKLDSPQHLGNSDAYQMCAGRDWMGLRMSLDKRRKSLRGLQRSATTCLLASEYVHWGN